MCRWSWCLGGAVFQSATVLLRCCVWSWIMLTCVFNCHWPLAGQVNWVRCGASWCTGVPPKRNPHFPLLKTTKLINLQFPILPRPATIISQFAVRSQHFTLKQTQSWTSRWRGRTISQLTGGQTFAVGCLHHISFLLSILLHYFLLPFLFSSLPSFLSSIPSSNTPCLSPTSLRSKPFQSLTPT